MSSRKAVARLPWLVLVLVLCVYLNSNVWAQDDGETGARNRTIVVHPMSTGPTDSGTELLEAMANITNASATNPWLIKLDAGVFDLGTSSLVMNPYVDIEGSGEGVTKITSASGAATVTGSSNAEIRFLTVASTVGTAVFVPVGTSPKLRNVTLTSSGGWSFAYGLNSNGQPILTDVTVNLPGGGSGIGLSGGELLRRVAITVGPGTGPVSGAISIGLDINQGYPQPIPITIVESTIFAANQGVFFGSGIENFTIERSTIKGGFFAVELLGEGPPATVRIGTSQLIGQVGPTFELACVGDYNGNYSPLNSSCQ
jgi:hypothetical protein